MDEVWKGVIELAYFTSDPSDLQTLRILTEWIFVGINKYDNRILDGIWLKDYNENLSLIRAQLDSIPDAKSHGLSGLSPLITKIFRQHQLKNIYQNMVKFEKGEICERDSKPMEMVICKPVVYPDGIGEMERCIVNEIQFLEENNFAAEK